MQRGVVVSFIFILILSLTIVSASDVAFIVKNSNRVEQGFLDALENMNLEVDVVEDRQIPQTDFSDYSLIFLSQNRLRNLDDLPLNEKNIVTINPYSVKELGFMTRNRVSRLTSNSFLRVKTSEGIKQVSENPIFIRRFGFSYYYLNDRYKTEQTQTVAKTDGGRDSLGDVISYIQDSQTGTNKCFFGIIESEYWTQHSKDLFENCVEFALQGELPPQPPEEPVCGNGICENSLGENSENCPSDCSPDEPPIPPEPPQTPGHDVKIDTEYSDTINGIRIKDIEADFYLNTIDHKLICDRTYRIDFRTMNVGNFTEDIFIYGELGDYNWTSSKDDLLPGGTTFAGAKTINISTENGFVPGFYNLRVESQISDDENPSDNVRERMMQVICGV